MALRRWLSPVLLLTVAWQSWSLAVEFRCCMHTFAFLHFPLPVFHNRVDWIPHPKSPVLEGRISTSFRFHRNGFPGAWYPGADFRPIALRRRVSPVLLFRSAIKQTMNCEGSV